MKNLFYPFIFSIYFLKSTKTLSKQISSLLCKNDDFLAQRWEKEWPLWFLLLFNIPRAWWFVDFLFVIIFKRKRLCEKSIIFTFTTYPSLPVWTGLPSVPEWNSVVCICALLVMRWKPFPAKRGCKGLEILLKDLFLKAIGALAKA